MNDPNNKKRLLFGLVMIIAAFVCVLGLFYFLVDFQKININKIESLEVSVNKLQFEREKVEEELESVKNAGPRPIDVQDIVNEAQKIYGPEEIKQTQGYLWIDRESAIYLVTLGALNGLKPGSRLVIYAGNEKVGLAVVEKPLDVISYVSLVGSASEDLIGDYYRVEL